MGYRAFDTKSSYRWVDLMVETEVRVAAYIWRQTKMLPDWVSLRAEDVSKPSQGKGEEGRRSMVPRALTWWLKCLQGQ